MITNNDIRKGTPITWSDIINGKAALLDGYIVSVSPDISFGFRVRGRERVSGTEYETILYSDDRSVILREDDVCDWIVDDQGVTEIRRDKGGETR